MRPVKFLMMAVTAAMLAACEKTVLLDIAQDQPRVIIEGLVADEPGQQYVKVTRSSGFYSTGPSPRIENASVSVSDDAGNEYVFVHNPRGATDSAGYYLPAVPFVGVAGRTYYLSVQVEEVLYEASDLLTPITTIDSLSSRINDNEREDPERAGKYYELLLFAKEPQDRTDYYLFKFYRNDTLVSATDTDIYFANDELLGENIDGVPSPVFYGLGDRAEIEVFSISREAYRFYSDLQLLLANDGGVFAQPPSNSRTNLTNGALGFFQASSLDRGDLIIKE